MLIENSVARALHLLSWVGSASRGIFMQNLPGDLENLDLEEFDQAV